MTLAGGFRLGDWVVRPADGSIVSGSTATRLEPQLMDLLVFLCSRPHEVVSKDDVLAHVWRGRFVSEDTLKAGFYQLRKALGDPARSPRYVETLPKRGYRLLLDPLPLERGDARQSGDAAVLSRQAASMLAAQPSAADLKQARIYFERALTIDPDQHEAQASLALVYVQLVALGEGGDLMTRARALSARATAAAAAGTVAQLAAGITVLLHDRDTDVAEKALRRAVALDGRAVPPHRWLAKLLSFVGRHDEAISEARHAAVLDPLSMLIRRDLVEVSFMARRYDEALDAAQRLLEVAGSGPDAHLGVAWIFWMKGDEQRTFDAVYAGFAAAGVAGDVLDGLARAFGQNRMRSVFRFWANALDRQATLGQKTLDPLFLYAVLGDHDRAFRFLEVLLRQCHPALLWIPVCPLFDGLRADVRYSGLLSQLWAGARP